jgi:hypothetical protein
LATVVAGRDLVTFDLTSLDREYALALAIGRGGLRLPVPAISNLCSDSLPRIPGPDVADLR